MSNSYDNDDPIPVRKEDLVLYTEVKDVEDVEVIIIRNTGFGSM